MFSSLLKWLQVANQLVPVRVNLARRAFSLAKGISSHYRGWLFRNAKTNKITFSRTTRAFARTCRETYFRAEVARAMTLLRMSSFKLTQWEEIVSAKALHLYLSHAKSQSVLEAISCWVAELPCRERFTPWLGHTSTKVIFLRRNFKTRFMLKM